MHDWTRELKGTSEIYAGYQVIYGLNTIAMLTEYQKALMVSQIKNNLQLVNRYQICYYNIQWYNGMVL